MNQTITLGGSSAAGGGTVDLLGLEPTPPAPSAAVSSGLNFLVDVFGDQPSSTTNGFDSTFGSGSGGLTPGAEENYKK